MMGNQLLVLKVKGITNYYAFGHIYEYQIGDFLYLTPEPSNEYDRNAVLITDIRGNKIGYVDKDLSFGVGIIVHNLKHYANIKEIYRGEHCSITFVLIYETRDYIFDVDGFLFDDLVNKYEMYRPHQTLNYEINNKQNNNDRTNNITRKNDGSKIKITHKTTNETKPNYFNSREESDYDRFAEDEAKSYYDREYGTDEDDYDVDPESFYDMAFNSYDEVVQEDDDRYDD